MSRIGPIRVRVRRYRPRTGPVHAGPNRIGPVRSGPGPDRTGLDRSGPVRSGPGPVRSGPVRSGPVRSWTGPVRSGPVRSGPVLDRTGPVQFGLVRPGPVRSSACNVWPGLGSVRSWTCLRLIQSNRRQRPTTGLRSNGVKYGLVGPVFLVCSVSSLSEVSTSVARTSGCTSVGGVMALHLTACFMHGVMRPRGVRIKTLSAVENGLPSISRTATNNTQSCMQLKLGLRLMLRYRTTTKVRL